MILISSLLYISTFVLVVYITHFFVTYNKKDLYFHIQLKETSIAYTNFKDNLTNLSSYVLVKSTKNTKENADNNFILLFICNISPNYSLNASFISSFINNKQLFNIHIYGNSNIKNDQNFFRIIKRYFIMKQHMKVISKIISDQHITNKSI